MDPFDISFVIWELSRSWVLTKPTLLDPDHFPGSPFDSVVASAAIAADTGAEGLEAVEKPQSKKNHFLHHFLFRIRPFCEKWIILIYRSSYGNFLEAGN